MLSHKLEIYKGSQSEKGHQKKVDFEIEVNGDFVTVSRKRLDHSNMLQSKSFKVEQDVLVIIQNSRNNLYSVELDWLWREPTRFDNLTLKQAEELKQLVEQLAQSKRELESQNLNLKGIKVGSQVWSESNIDIDVGLDCSFPVLEGRVLKKSGVYIRTKALKMPLNNIVTGEYQPRKIFVNCSHSSLKTHGKK